MLTCRAVPGRTLDRYRCGPGFCHGLAWNQLASTASPSTASPPGPTDSIDQRRQPPKELAACFLRDSAATPVRTLPGRKEREEDIPAEQSAPQEEAWVPLPDADEAWPRDSLPPAAQGPQASDGLTLGRSSSPRCTGVAAPGTERIRSSRDYRNVYRRGRRLHGDVAVLHVRANDAGRPRLGLTASRRVGGAVVRNRLRRRVREHYRQQVRRDLLPAVDMVVHLKPGAAAADRRSFYRELNRLFRAVARRGAGHPRRRRSSKS